MIKYKGGRVVPPNVLSALRYTAKVGVMSRAVWNEFFGQGALRWRQRQLLHLIGQRILRCHSCEPFTDTFVLADYGKRILDEMKVPYVSSVPSKFIRHDETVGAALLKLERAGVCHHWLTERELMTQNYQEYLIRGKEGETKYPDAVFKIMINGKPRTIAIEYERTGKDLPRYRSILWQYNGISNVSMILYIVGNQKIKRHIKRALNFQGNTQLLGRIGFMDAENWLRDPIKSPIELNQKATSFEKLCLINTSLQVDA